MFGIGFTELVLISIIAILFLGPDKLPEALVDMAKFIKNVKKTITDAKDTFEEEVKLSDLKEEALSYKRQLDDATTELKSFKNISLDDFDDESYDDEISEMSPMDHVKATQKAENPYVEAPKELKEPTTTTVDETPKETTVESENTLVTFKKKDKPSVEKNTEIQKKTEPKGDD
ncbi:MAG TPA: Sec-independent protein translocase subunit TatB [Sulfurovum sp.]|nr:Sec-independent protein translocase subunit TatB [Sulfurovum sp.]